ncbi:MAG: recombinase family protein [Fimbriimonadaceae bacterium]|nr:recombinase family protein [Fimbriimonadaceae bacterium]QOJ13037.1 MAG: recombinase family protein [Chthonomonadaceae bacterium]
MFIGYQRVSTTDQSVDLQSDALSQAGCERTFTDHASGAKADRPGLTEALAFARPGDCLVVWRLDRLGRSLRNLIDVVADLEARGVGFRSLQESIDTTTSGGKLVFHVFAALAEFERTLLVERSLAGIKAARARGRSGGRRALLTGKKLELARKLRGDHNMPVAEACRILGCSKATFYRSTSNNESA